MGLSGTVWLTLLLIVISVAFLAADFVGEDVSTAQELLLQVEGEHFLLACQDDVASVQELDLRGALESATTYLCDFTKALDHLSVIATIEYVVNY
jgi:hypothetical protein